MLCPDEETQSLYLATVEQDINRFVSQHKDVQLNGFDIGGGTPTALSEDNFRHLMRIYRQTVNQLCLSEDFEPSIEASFATITAAKAEMIRQAGINRVSLGLQSSCSSVLQQNHRMSARMELLADKMNLLHQAGIRKINLDLMYGLRGQTLETLPLDVESIKRLNPEQVTLYELRTNMTGESMKWNKETLYEGYAFLFSKLCALGYHAQFGQNTFTRKPDDQGVSSYLRHRMIDGTAYKGFGLSAQSMCSDGLSYNIGKNATEIGKLIPRATYDEEFTYRLPATELASKYIAIGAYHGSFSLTRLSEILGEDARIHYATQLSFCLSHGLIVIGEDDTVSCTREGFKYYGAIFSLFTRYEL
jgi:oxygen-independent coproporphyrinogen-3 oxidase